MLVTTGPNGSVAKSSANGLVDTGFAYRYRLQPRAGQWVGVSPLDPLLSHKPLTGLLLTTNLLS